MLSARELGAEASFGSSVKTRNINSDKDRKMARIAGIDLPNKHVDVGLPYIYGIGAPSASAICNKTGIDPDRMLNDLAPEEVNDLRRVIENDYVVDHTANLFLVTSEGRFFTLPIKDNPDDLRKNLIRAKKKILKHH